MVDAQNTDISVSADGDFGEMIKTETPSKRRELAGMLSPEGRLCRECLFLNAIKALARLPSHECDARIKVRLGFLV